MTAWSNPLKDRSSHQTRGASTGLEIVSTEWRPSPDLENAASRGVIRVQVQVSEVLVGELATPEITWQMPAWIGDPAYSDEYERTVQEAIGMGPIGARAVLFLTAADAPAPTFSAYSGVLEANGASVRVDFGRYSPHDSGSDFASVATLEAAVRSAIGRG